MPSLAEVVKGDPAALVALCRDCVKAKAQLRGDRVADVSDVFEFIAELGYDTSGLTVEWATKAIFEQPEWEFQGLWTALRRRDVPRGKRPRLVKVWHLTGQPARRRRFDGLRSRILAFAQPAAEVVTA